MVKLNHWRAFWHELPAIIEDIDGNARARCIVISSTGKHFCAGMALDDARGARHHMDRIIAALVIGVIVVAPDLKMPALTEYIHGGGPIIPGKLFPFLFVTIACGAILLIIHWRRARVSRLGQATVR